ncbi:hypothetical protein IWQ60_000014 [Tieghemiomyces parasiticus]|uniref:HCP-like protein n=1 Tax=Tieghemiomyces parasiticus TaxID=78921 RepID=A0A9W8AFJ5_9FUNG|nr:hypothetical protein IWQ60_000014 [Tieghemiomyces parasiticus]
MSSGARPPTSGSGSYPSFDQQRPDSAAQFVDTAASSPRSSWKAEGQPGYETASSGVSDSPQAPHPAFNTPPISPPGVGHVTVARRPSKPLPTKPSNFPLDHTFQTLALSPPASVVQAPGQTLLIPQQPSDGADCNSISSSTTSPDQHQPASGRSSYSNLRAPVVPERPAETLNDPHTYLRPTSQDLYDARFPRVASGRSLADSSDSDDDPALSTRGAVDSGFDNQGFDSGYPAGTYNRYSQVGPPTATPPALHMPPPSLAPPAIQKSQSHSPAPRQLPQPPAGAPPVAPAGSGGLPRPPNAMRLKSHNSSTPDLASAAAQRLSHPQHGFDGPIPRNTTSHYATTRGPPGRPTSSYYQMHSNSSGELRPHSMAEGGTMPYGRHSASVTSFQQNGTRNSMFFGSQRGSRLSVTLLNEKSALGMYREAAKKTNDPHIQLEFAKYLIECANEEGGAPLSPTASATGTPHGSPRLGPQLTPSEVAATTQESKQKLMEEAVYWIRQLEKQAHPEACFIAAEWYEEGRHGLPKDADKAVSNYLIASKHNVAYASFKMGKYYEGRKQASKSLSFFQKGAAQGDVSCNFRLAQAHLRGELHQAKSVRQALIYLRRSAVPDERCSEGAYLLALMYLGEFYECNVQDQIFKDNEEAQKLLERAAQFGNNDAQYRLGQAFEFGEAGYEADPVFSVSYYRMAAEQGHKEAQMALSAWYLSGSPGTVEQNDSLAFKWCAKSAEQGLVKAEFAMGYYYEVGIGTPVDTGRAMEWYRLAVSHGNQEAQQRMDKLLGNSRESSRDLKRKVTKKRAKKDNSGCRIF